MYVCVMRGVYGRHDTCMYVLLGESMVGMIHVCVMSGVYGRHTTRMYVL